jgi:broad-specificity NMP kinase
MANERNPPVFLVTGTPGTGKTAVARALAKKFNGIWVNELDFARKNKIGRRLPDGEWEIPLPQLKRKLVAFLKKQKKPVFLDGHVLCEIRLPVDYCFVLTCTPAILEKRLRKRKYSELTVLDNTAAEQNGYCLRLATRLFGRKVKKVSTNQQLRQTLRTIAATLSKVLA